MKIFKHNAKKKEGELFEKDMEVIPKEESNLQEMPPKEEHKKPFFAPELFSAGNDVYYPWFSAPNVVTPKWLIPIYQASHLSEPLLAILSLRVADSPILAFISSIRSLLFVVRQHSEYKDSITFLSLVFYAFCRKFLFKRTRDSLFAKVVKFNGLLQFILWSCVNVESTSFNLLRMIYWTPVTLLSNYFHHKFQISNKLGFQPVNITPDCIQEINKEWIERGIRKTLPNAPQLEKIECVAISGAKDATQENATGFIGEVARVNLSYKGGSSLDSSLPKSVVVKFSPQGTLPRLKYRPLSLALREAFFYERISPKMVDNEENSKNDIGTFMLQVPKNFRAHYSEARGCSTLLMEDAKYVKSSKGNGLIPGDELKGATWAQACSVAVRYARFHAIHWRKDLESLMASFPELNLYRQCDWMDLPPSLTKDLINASLTELEAEEFKDDELTPSDDSKGIGSWVDVLKPSHQKLIKLVHENYHLLIKMQKQQTNTFVHADSRMENMMWPEVEESSDSKKLAARAEPDQYYEKKSNKDTTWFAVDWQTCSKGCGIFDVAYFVTMSLFGCSHEDIKMTRKHDETLVGLYHEELLRHSASAREAGYSYDQCMDDYKLSCIVSMLIPFAVMRKDTLSEVGYKMRGRAVRKYMFKRWANAVDRLGLLDFFQQKLALHLTPRRMVSPLPVKKDHEAKTVTDPAFEIPLAKVDPKAMHDKNLYDRWFLNATAKDGKTFVAFGFGIYPNRNVIDATISVVRDGVQRNLRASKHIPSVTNFFDLDCVQNLNAGRYAVQVGPIKLEILECLKKIRLTSSTNDEMMEVDLIFSAAAYPILEPDYDMMVAGIGHMKYQRLTQLVRTSGTIKFSDSGEAVEINGAMSLRDRSWGVRPHNHADKPAEKNYKAAKLLKSPLGGVIDAIAGHTGKPQFYWFWMPVSFKHFGVLFHSQQDAHGTVTNGAVKLMGKLDIPTVADENEITQRISEQENDFETVKTEPESVSTNSDSESDSHLMQINKNLTVLSAHHELELLPGTRHAKSGKLMINVEDNVSGKKFSIEVVFKPLFPFFMTGVGYAHPEFGHGAKLSSSVSTVFDKVATQLQDRTDNLCWHIQEVCELSLVVAGKTVEKSVGTVEQLTVGPYKPLGLTGLFSV